MPPTEFERDPEEVLAGVYRRGHVLRRRRQLVRAGSVVAAVALLAGIPAALALGGGGGGHGQLTIAGSGTTTTVVEETTTVAPTTTTTAAAPVPTTTAKPRPTTTTTTPCHNSHDPACGPFYWDRDPGPNQPMTMHVTYSPASPKAGETVTFALTAADPDAQPSSSPCDVRDDYGDGSPNRLIACSRPNCPVMYGPWTPETKSGRFEKSYDHVYEKSGTYTVTFEVPSFAYCLGVNDPYHNDGSASVTVTVSVA